MPTQDMEILKVSDSQKYDVNPFLDKDVLQIDKGKKTIITGSTKDILVNTDTGEATGVAFLHRYKEVDREQFIKVYINEVSALFELSKTGLKVFGYLLNCMQINKAEVYLHIPDLMVYCNYKHKSQVYKGLAELIKNKILAPSKKHSIWFINPHFIFNGDRIAFIKEYRLKQPAQMKLYGNQEI